MLELYNVDRNISSKKKKHNGGSYIYTEAIKMLCKEVKKLDFELITRLDIHFNEEFSKDISVILLEIYMSENIKYSDIKKMLKKIYEKYTDRYLILVYVISFGNIIARDTLARVSRQSNYNLTFNEKIDISDFTKLDNLMGTFALLSIIIRYDLLNYSIDEIVISENDNEVKIKRSAKRENVSIIKGTDDFPYLLNLKENVNVLGRKVSMVDMYKKYNVPAETEKILNEHFGKIFYQKILAMICFGKEFSRYTNFKYEDFTNIECAEGVGLTFRSISIRSLKTRKVLPPKGGLILKVNNHPNIDSIYLNETTCLEQRFLYGVVKYKNGSENVFSGILKNEWRGIAIYAKDVDAVVSILIKFYKIDLRFFNGSGQYEEFDFDVLSPVYWKYRDNNYETEDEKELRLKTGEIKKKYSIEISSFIRKIKGNPSKESVLLAEKYCVELEPNTTIVRAHFRNYKK